MTHHAMRITIARELHPTGIKGLWRYRWMVRVMVRRSDGEDVVGEARCGCYEEAMYASERLERDYWRTYGPHAEKAGR